MMNPYLHFSPEQKKLIYCSLAYNRNKIVTRKIEIQNTGINKIIKATLVSFYQQQIDAINIEMGKCSRATNETLKLS